MLVVCDASDLNNTNINRVAAAHQKQLTKGEKMEKNEAGRITENHTGILKQVMQRFINALKLLIACGIHDIWPASSINGYIGFIA